MGRIQLVGEDRLCCAVGKKLIDEHLSWPLIGPPIDTKGVTNLRAAMPRYREVARRFPLLCIADVDRGCAAQLSRDLHGAHPASSLIVRLAVREVESWILADGERFAEFLGVAASKVPTRPDDDPDPKLTVLSLARRAKTPGLRREMVSESNPNRPGSGYNVHMSIFVSAHWSSARAAANSPSLARAIDRLRSLTTPRR